ncbi:MAG: hypothetical protein SFV55_19460 [Haliscomenobacter sp.]|uniref:hypothetical protein n=1 Tax=Haliscomenobacter sp. TaxID=2717303 RepID=UPI0029ADEA0E|nr:hypothetical protein [Haliscomenobacter sp.]MDX2070615.1 hypothetical protein [Haliscomenobacter sp.]
MGSRFISDYLDQKVLNQKHLIHALEERGYEKNDARILTTPLFGVPTTVYVLLLNENLVHIENFQKSFESKYISKNIQYTDLPSAFEPKYVGKPPYQDWETKMYPSIDPEVNASGSMGFKVEERHYPSKFSESPLNELYKSRDDKAEVREDYLSYVKSGDDSYLIEPFKYILTYIEISYALSERVKILEQNLFNKKFNIKLNCPKIPSEFQSICQIRVDIITHPSTSNVPRFQISKEHKLQLGNHLVAEKFKSAFLSTCDWLNDVYGVMLKELNTL